MSSRTDGMKVVRAHEAMELARRGAPIHKAADPTEDERRHISLEDARAIAAEDPSLLFCEVPDVEAYLANGPDELGHIADEHDLKAYNERLRAAWLERAPISHGGADLLCTAVLEGRHGDWVEAAAIERGAALAMEKGREDAQAMAREGRWVDLSRATRPDLEGPEAELLNALGSFGVCRLFKAPPKGREAVLEAYREGFMSAATELLDSPGGAR